MNQRTERTGRALRAARDAGRESTELAAANADQVVDHIKRGMEIWLLQESTAAKVRALVPEQKRDAFDDVIQLSLHAYMVREQKPAPEYAFQAALRRHDLTDQQRVRLQDEHAAYRSMRAAAAPALRAAYLQSCDPNNFRQIYLLRDIDRKQFIQSWQAKQQSWDDLQTQWFAKCDRVVDEIKAMVGERPPETQP